MDFGVGAMLGLAGFLMLIPLGGIYVIYSLFLMFALKDLQYPKPGLAWVPIYSWWVFTEAVYGKVPTFKSNWLLKDKELPIIVMKLAPVIIYGVAGILGIIPILGAIASSVFTFLASYMIIGAMYEKVCSLYNRTTDPVITYMVGVPRFTMFIQMLFWKRMGLVPQGLPEMTESESYTTEETHTTFDTQAYDTMPTEEEVVTEEQTTADTNSTNSLWD